MQSKCTLIAIFIQWWSLCPSEDEDACSAHPSSVCFLIGGKCSMVTLHHKHSHMSQLEWSFLDVDSQELDSTRGCSFARAPALRKVSLVSSLLFLMPVSSPLHPTDLQAGFWLFQEPVRDEESGRSLVNRQNWEPTFFLLFDELCDVSISLPLSAAFHFPWRDALVVWMLASQLFQVFRSLTFTSSFFQPTEQNPSQLSMPQPHSCSSDQFSFLLLLRLSSMGPLCSPSAGNRSQSITLSNARETYPFWKQQEKDNKGRDHKAQGLCLSSWLQVALV